MQVPSFCIWLENVMSLNQTKAAIIGLLEATENLVNTMKQNHNVKASRKQVSNRWKVSWVFKKIKCNPRGNKQMLFPHEEQHPTKMLQEMKWLIRPYISTKKTKLSFIPIQNSYKCNIYCQNITYLPSLTIKQSLNQQTEHC